MAAANCLPLQHLVVRGTGKEALHHPVVEAADIHPLTIATNSVGSVALLPVVEDIITTVVDLLQCAIVDVEVTFPLPITAMEEGFLPVGWNEIEVPKTAGDVVREVPLLNTHQETDARIFTVTIDIIMINSVVTKMIVILARTIDNDLAGAEATTA